MRVFEFVSICLCLCLRGVLSLVRVFLRERARARVLWRVRVRGVAHVRELCEFVCGCAYVSVCLFVCGVRVRLGRAFLRVRVHL